MAQQQAFDLACFAGGGEAGLPYRGAPGGLSREELAADASAFLAELQGNAAVEAALDGPAGLSTPAYLAAYAWRIKQLIAPLAAANRFHPARLERALKAAVLRAFVDVANSIEPGEPGVPQGDAAQMQREEDLYGMNTLGSVLGDVNAAACELAYLKKDADEGISNSEALAAASQKLFISVFEITQSTEEASTEAAAADESAMGGLGAVQHAVGAMQHIEGAVEDTAKKLDDLSRASAQIGQILSLTNSIAGQTKLLALNATIEAARAGVAGRGFAVVANEVKRLAEQSSKASEEISRRIAALHDEMEIILKTMAQTVEAVSEGKRAIASAGSTLDSMSHQVSTVAHKMAEIAGILKEQSGVAGVMAECVDRISSRSKEANVRLLAAAQKLRASTRMLLEKEQSARRSGSPQSTLRMARLEHLLLARQVTDVLLGSDEWPSAQLLDPGGCRVSEWLGGYGQASAGRGKLAELHQRVHATAKTVLEAYKSNDSEGALQALSDFIDVNNGLGQAIDKLLEDASSVEAVGQ
ncbi:MAG: methyl-accepting chemotaxis protein [Rhodomicrobium sp.]